MEIFIILLLILLNGLFSMSEVALISARKSSLTADAKKGSRTAKNVLNLTERPNKFLSTVQIGITLIGILTGLYSGDSIAYKFSDILEGWGLVESVAQPVAQVTIVIIVTYLTIVLGELVPKRLGMGSPESIAKVVSGPMLVLSWIATPFVWILDKSTSLFTKAFHVEEKESKVTEEEIKSMVAEGKEDGEVQDVEQDIVERVFSLGDRSIESIMTSRNEIIWIDREMTREEINTLVQEHLFEVYPVGDGSLDEIVGVVYLKDLFGKLDKDKFSLDDIIRPVQYFHEYTDVYKVLEQMKKAHVTYGLVCDEFGVCQGIVTYKDILEGLVGSIDDEEDEPDIIERKSGGWLVDGQCPFYDFLAHFDMEDLAADNDYNTVGGLILEMLEHIPQSGEYVDWNGFRLEVVDMDGPRIDKVLVNKLQPAPEEEARDEEKEKDKD